MSPKDLLRSAMSFLPGVVGLFQSPSSHFPGRHPDWPKTQPEFEDFWADTGAVEQYLDKTRLAFYQEIIHQLPQESQRILDLGCGGGQFFRILADTLKEKGSWPVMVGVDYAKSAVRLASQLVPEATFLQSPADDTNLPDESFDLVLSLETLEHLKRPRAALFEAWRLVSPGGNLIITIPDAAQDRWRGHTQHWSAEQFLRFLGDLPVQAWCRVDSGRTLFFHLAKPSHTHARYSVHQRPADFMLRAANRLLARWRLRLNTVRHRPVFLSDLGRFHYQTDMMGLKLARDAKVIDVGSGHYPFPYATILGDLTTGYTVHRSETLKRDSRPLVVFDIHHMPFADRSIDFVYCSHVLEHLQDPELACSELQRVGKEGYVEVPTLGKDILFGWASGMHKWHIVAAGNTLVFFEYSAHQAQGIASSAWRDLILGPTYHPLQTVFYENEGLFNVRFRWRDNFGCVVYRLTGGP